MELTPTNNPLSAAESKPEIEKVVKAEVGYKLTNTAKYRPGHKMFSYNRETGEVAEVKVESKVVMGEDGSIKYKRDLKMDPICVYGQALNKKNFIRKLENIAKDYADNPEKYKKKK